MNKRHRLRSVNLRQGIGSTLLFLAIALLVINSFGVMRSCRRLRGLAPGMIAPGINLESLDGRRVRLSDLRGKVVLLDFWATWCQPCVRKFPLLFELQRSLVARGFQVLAINIENDISQLRQFSAHKRLADSGIITLLDDARASTAYGVSTIPHIAIVGRDGRIVHVHIGAGGEASIRDRIAVALGRP